MAKKTQQIQLADEIANVASSAAPPAPAAPAASPERGPEAVRVWTERWLDNNGDNLSEYDLDHMALDAKM